MRSPALTLAGNLMWTRTGTVWATWRLSPVAYGYRKGKDKEAARSWHQALFRALPGESMLISACARVDPSALVERMLTGVDIEHHSDWAAECAATLDTLDEIALADRTYWLSIPLAADGPADHFTRPLHAATANLRDLLTLPRMGVPKREMQRRVAQAERAVRGVPAVFRPVPATTAQQVWLTAHAQFRGLSDDLDLPGDGSAETAEGDMTSQLLMTKTTAAIPEPLLDEGGQSDLSRGELKGWNPVDRRYVKVVAADRPDAAASYQAMLVLADVPPGGMIFPGSEFVGRVDESGVDVDWAIRLDVKASDKVLTTNRRALVNLNDQYHQREGELSHGVSVLDRAADELAEYSDILQSDRMEVEVQTTTIFCTAAPTPEAAADQARRLAAYFSASDYQLSQPLGYQEQLWWAMQPGPPATHIVREFAQIAPSRAVSAMVPLASSALGDRCGSLLGLNITTARPSAVLHDLDGASGRDNSGSVAIAGEKGAGKSLTLKKLAGDVVDRGGRIICIDRTPVGEYATWAESMAMSTLVDIGSPEVSLDPLRLLGPRAGSRVAQSFLTPLLGIAPTSDRGVLLADVLDTSYLHAHDLPSLGAVLSHLQHDCTMPGASELARVMNVYARRDFGAVIFDPSLPGLDLDAPAIVVRTHALELPTRDELEHHHLFEQLRLEKTFGRAVYALITALARQVCFAETSRFAMFVCDEAHHITGSPEGERELADFIRDDRKHNAAIALGSHDPSEDFGSETMRGLIPTRILMRHRNGNLARRGLEWLDMDADDDQLIEIVTSDLSPVEQNGVDEHRRGEGFIRDAAGNLGRIKILAPAQPARAEAARTTPPELPK